MKIICIGRNYAEHAKELNNAVPTEPVFFMKPDTALIRNGQPFYHPDFSNDIHHEIELVLVVCKTGKNIDEKFASKYYNKIAIGIDFTARDLQNKAKEKGLPWEKAKAFDGSAPLGESVDVSTIKDVNDMNFHLTINGKTVQQGNTKDLLFSFDKIITYISRFITLRTGDLIYTGTPAGVGKVNIGDKLEGFIEGNKMLEFAIK
jgi:2-keto-4-pentenoate hydratase/2-oxohepta-3-ene-1,7-dioic acid hydratase in catechol pathway